MSKLDDIIEKSHVGAALAHADEQTKQAIKDLFLELVGEDETYPMVEGEEPVALYDADDNKVIRNLFRAELRQKVSKL